MFIYEVLSSRGHGTRVIVGESYLLFTCFTCWAMRNHFSTGWAMRNHFLPVGQWETIFYRLINEKPLFTDWSMRNHFFTGWTMRNHFFYPLSNEKPLFYKLSNEKPLFHLLSNEKPLSLPVEQWETTVCEILPKLVPQCVIRVFCEWAFLHTRQLHHSRPDLLCRCAKILKRALKKIFVRRWSDKKM